MEDEKKENVDTQTTTDNAQKEQKTEHKNEGEKTKKQVAQKGDDGSIVFKNQDELDASSRHSKQTRRQRTRRAKRYCSNRLY